MRSMLRNERVVQARAVDKYSLLVFRLALLAALLAAIPRVLAATPSCEAHAIRSHEVLRAESLANWEPLNDQTVLIWTRHSAQASLVRLAAPLDGLTSAPIIVLVAGNGDRMISPCGRDALMLGDDRSQAVRIVAIRLLSARLTAALDAVEQAPQVATSHT